MVWPVGLRHGFWAYSEVNQHSLPQAYHTATHLQACNGSAHQAAYAVHPLGAIKSCQPPKAGNRMRTCGTLIGVFTDLCAPLHCHLVEQGLQTL